MFHSCDSIENCLSRNWTLTHLSTMKSIDTDVIIHLFLYSWSEKGSPQSFCFSNLSIMDNLLLLASLAPLCKFGGVLR
jgi:hypothetical protein